MWDRGDKLAHIVALLAIGFVLWQVVNNHRANRVPNLGQNERVQ